ncbi:MAG TPA: hypothetical protein VFW75_06830, partial [Acetobacteraceae bacterium]|nr:hypothetical protein [Acetobacteraceae bacterium]
MLRPILLVLAVLALALPASAHAAQNPMPAVHADQWEQAAADAAGYADPVAAKLVTYYRLLAPGQASAEEIAAFMAANPDWPNQAVLERRRQEAIAAAADDDVVLGPCTHSRITVPAALARCATALAKSDGADAVADARAAWVGGYADPAGEAAFLKQWSADFTPADEWARFQHFAWSDATAAAHQVPRLAPAMRSAAKARLALIQGAPDALALAQALPAAARGDPGLVLDEARWLRRGKRDADALTLWQQRGEAAERASGTHLPAFWKERAILARELLKDGDNNGAYAMADDRLVSSASDIADAGFLAGFIALRRLDDATRATAQFQRVADASRAAISQGRAHYWLGRAAAAAGRDPHAEYEQAAAYPTTFYGQLAARALGRDPAALIRSARDPAFTRDQAWAFTAHELVRAAAILVAWGEPGRARAFLLRMNDVAPSPVEQALCARLALALEMPD